MLQGSCLCGEIEYRVTSTIGKAYYCHCQRCRKASGTLFAANGIIDGADFQVIKGSAKLKSYTNEESGLKRLFCGECGSPIASARPNGSMAIRLGSVDSEIVQGPEAHIFVGSKAIWDHFIDDGLPTFDNFPQDQ